MRAIGWCTLNTLIMFDIVNQGTRVCTPVCITCLGVTFSKESPMISQSNMLLSNASGF